MCTATEPAAPASAGEALAMVRAGLGYLADCDAGSLGTAAQADALIGLEAAEAQHTAARARILAAFTAQQGYEADGYYGPASWLRAITRVTRGAAAAAAGWARRLAAHPVIAAALAAGQLPVSLARLICDWTDKLPEDYRADADGILLAAVLGGADQHDLARLGREMLDRAQTSPDRDSDGFEERALWLGTTFGGAGRLHADLTPACAAALTVVLDALGQKAGPEDTRTAAQRRHDAVEEACRRLIGGQLIPGRDGQPPHLTVHIDLNDLRAARRVGAGTVLDPGPRGGRARVGVPDRARRRGRGLRRGAHPDGDRADRLGRAGPAHHRLAHRPRPRPHRQPAGRPPGRATGRPRRRAAGKPAGRPAGRPPARAAGRPRARPREDHADGPQERPRGRAAGRPPGRAAGRPRGRAAGRPRGTGRRKTTRTGRRKTTRTGRRKTRRTGRGTRRDAGRPGGRPRTTRRTAAGATRPRPAATATSRSPAPATARGPGEVPAAADDHDCGIAGCLEATRRRLQATILRWSLDLLSGPGGLASQLRGTLLGAPFSTPSQPLDLGRTTRTIPPHLRTAVIQRDQHCQFPGCTQPPSVCDVHHLIPWAKGGPTSLANLRLLCRFHHLVVIHRWRWTITCHPDGTTTATAPDGRTLHSHGPPRQTA